MRKCCSGLPVGYLKCYGKFDIGYSKYAVNGIMGRHHVRSFIGEWQQQPTVNPRASTSLYTMSNLQNKSLLAVVNKLIIVAVSHGG